jgi:hypothetical protein
VRAADLPSSARPPTRGKQAPPATPARRLSWTSAYAVPRRNGAAAFAHEQCQGTAGRRASGCRYCVPSDDDIAGALSATGSITSGCCFPALLRWPGQPKPLRLVFAQSASADNPVFGGLYGVPPLVLPAGRGHALWRARVTRGNPTWTRLGCPSRNRAEPVSLILRLGLAGWRPRRSACRARRSRVRARC